MLDELNKFMSTYNEIINSDDPTSENREFVKYRTILLAKALLKDFDTDAKIIVNIRLF